MSVIKKVIVTVSCMILINCGKAGEKDTIDIGELYPLLKERYNLYRHLITEEMSPEGFVESSQCDSTLFSGLVGTVVPVELETAKDGQNRWFRRPLNNGQDTCYPAHSSSTISRDMFIGIMWYIWKNKRLDLAVEIWNYGKANDWIMGEGDASRIYFTPAIKSTLAELIYRLGGTNHIITRNIPRIFTKGNIGFKAHLDVLHLLLRADMIGSLESNDIIKHHYNRNRNNALFNYVYHKYNTGNQTETALNLLNTRYFPESRLPTAMDRNTPWLWERDLGDDWQPTTDPNKLDKVHSGGDYLFVTKLIFDDLGYE